MCGIFTYLGKTISIEDLKYGFDKLKPRGPDHSIIKNITHNIVFGFHRLSINDISDNGNQPLVLDDLSIICNGEIYNHSYLKTKFGFVTQSGSDCEIILHLYRHFDGNIDSFINLLDGVFAFVLYDSSKDKIIVARDPFGVRPLFYGVDYHGEFFFSSELKGICEICNGPIVQFPPGAYCTLNWDTLREMYVAGEIVKWFDNTFKIDYTIDSEESFLPNIRDLFYEAVNKRLMSDRPICCLLSGGLDSSLVAAIVAKQFPRGHLHTFSIGMENSPDLYYAKIVSEFIGSTHHEIIMTEAQFLEAIPETIKVTESYDTTTIRASVGNYLISKYIAEHTDFKVVYNGDGSDEFGSYLYFSKCPSEQEFHDESVKLLNEINFFDVLRSDRSISSNGLEARVPFLDKAFASYYASIPPKFKMHTYGKIEKYILRKAFEQENLLPGVVLWRSKMAFSDGVSQKSKSWHVIVSEYIDTLITDEEFEINKKNYTHCQPQLKESYFYRLVFENYFGPNSFIVIPHFWLPKWCGDIIDPSARTLSFVND